MQEPLIPVPDDGLPTMSVGEWAVLDKHERIRRYVAITSATRKKYLPPRPGAGGAAYIDLYSGPGRVRVRESGAVHHGSPIVAWNAAVDSNSAFTQLILGDADQTACDAIHKRLSAMSAPVTTHQGYAVDTAAIARRQASPAGLHFALLDPFSLEQLPFGVIEVLAELRRIDIVIHVSSSDLQRNLPRFLDSKDCELDRFAPNWRRAIQPGQSQERMRQAIREHYLNSLRALGLHVADHIPHVRGSNNQTLYWLVQCSRHRLANRFWDIADEAGPQRNLL